MDLPSWLLLLAGVGLLAAGGDVLVRGSTRIALLAGLSPLVVGLTVVAFGTSSPELAVSLMAGAAGESGIAVGNVVGSNVFNVLFVLGLSALVTPLVVAQRLVRREVPLMIALSVLVLLLARDGTVGRLEGALLSAGVVAYTVWSVRVGRRETRPVREAYDREVAPGDGSGHGAGGVAAAVGLVVLGLAMLVAGSRWLVEGASALARSLGIGDAVVGLTVVAAGTSMPEAATSVAAAARGERDIAVGNVVGSNIFNLLAVLGLAAVASPEGLEAARSVVVFDLPVMTAVAVACLPVFFTGHRIDRWEGALFLVCYGGYTVHLVLTSTGRVAPATLGRGAWVLGGVLVAATAVVAGVRLWRRRSGGGRSGEG